MRQKKSSENLNGIYKDIAEIIGYDNANKIFQEYRGQQITFPVDFFSKEYIYAQIVADFDGKNWKALAIRYNYSERTIRRILTKKEATK